MTSVDNYIMEGNEKNNGIIEDSELENLYGKFKDRLFCSLEHRIELNRLLDEFKKNETPFHFTLKRSPEEIKKRF